MCLFCVLILLNCHMFLCVLNLTFHIPRQVSSILIRGMFRKKMHLVIWKEVYIQGQIFNQMSAYI